MSKHWVLRLVHNNTEPYLGLLTGKVQNITDPDNHLVAFALEY